MFDLPLGSGRSIKVNTASGQALLRSIEGDLIAGRGFAVATINLDHVQKLQTQARFREAYAQHSYVVADGNPIMWMSRLAGQAVELTPGSEMVDPLMAVAARLGVPVAFLGSTIEVLDGAAARLEARHPGLRIVARIAPPFGFDPLGEGAEACLAEVAQSGARLCLVALGAPKQELLAARGLGLVPGCGFVSVGASLDFVIDAQRRAPRWVRRIAMEWLWRMLSDPRRLARRYIGCALILPGLALRTLQARSRAEAVFGTARRSLRAETDLLRTNEMARKAH